MLPNFIDIVSKLVNKLDTIQISIDGLGEVYETIRHKASFSILDKNLQLLAALCKGSKTTLMLNMVVTKENYFQMPELVKYAEKIGIQYMDFSQLNLAAVTNINSSYYNFYSSEVFLSTIAKLKVECEKSDTVSTNYNFKTESGFQKCPFPWSHFYICWNGFISPCCAKPFPKELEFGNVFESNVIEVLNSKKYFAFRDLWFENSTPEFCNKCHYTSH